jgi:hypothetical protein
MRTLFSKRTLSDSNDLTLVVEKLRLRAYASFLVVVLVGILLTNLFANIDLNDSLLMQVFGFNNICVYFDYPPSTYVLPFLWAITLVLMLQYMVAHWLQMSAQVEQGTLNRKLYRILTRMKLFEAFTVVSFSTIFAVSPEGWNHTLFIHTVPFFLLQIGLVSQAISNTLHGTKSGYWRRLGLPAWFNRAAITYCILFSIIVFFKILSATNAMAGSPWWHQTDLLKRVAQDFDRMFFFLAVVVPMVKMAYLAYYRSEKLEVVHLTVSSIKQALLRKSIQ